MDHSERLCIIKKLREFARGYRVQIRVFKNSKSMGRDGYKAFFNVNTNVVSIDMAAVDSNEEFVYILAHEIGHAIDLSKETEEETEKLENAYIDFASYSNKGKRVPDEVQKILLERELRAFKEADKLLQELGVDIPEPLRTTLVAENEYSYLNAFNLDPDETD